MGPRETSQVLTKVFAALRSKQVRRWSVTAEVGLTSEEMNRLLFGLTLMTFEGEGRHVTAPATGSLSIVL